MKHPSASPAGHVGHSPSPPKSLSASPPKSPPSRAHDRDKAGSDSSALTPAGSAHHTLEGVLDAGEAATSNTANSASGAGARGLRGAGLKVTGPRRKILGIFQQTRQRHLSAEEVYRHLLEQGEDVGIATVYRVLTHFENVGILRRSHFETGRAVFELEQGSHHDHLVCMRCGRVEEFVDREIEQRQQAIAQARGFRLREHTLALYADCLREPCEYQQEAGGV